jgi:hypothetical protein
MCKAFLILQARFGIKRYFRVHLDEGYESQESIGRQSLAFAQFWPFQVDIVLWPNGLEPHNYHRIFGDVD